MNENIQLIAERIAVLRDIMEITTAEMAEVVGISEEEYKDYEAGNRDFTFSFLYTVADKLGVNITDILTGQSAKLSVFSLVRAGEGLQIHRRKEYEYQHLAYIFKNKKMEPFLVVSQPDEEEIPMHSHIGQEFNYILEGSMTIYVGDSSAVLHPGDAVYFDSKYPHSTRAENGKPCKFLAIIAK